MPGRIIFWRIRLDSFASVAGGMAEKARRNHRSERMDNLPFLSIRRLSFFTHCQLALRTAFNERSIFCGEERTALNGRAHDRPVLIVLVRFRLV